MSYYPIDSLKHCTPLVVVSGLQIPDDPDNSDIISAHSWTNNASSCPPTVSDVASHPFLSHCENIVGHEDSTVIMPALYSKFISKSHPPEIWCPISFDVSRRNAEYLLNLQFTNSRDEYLLPCVTSRSFYSSPSIAGSGILSRANSPAIASVTSFQQMNTSTTSLSEAKQPAQKVHSPLSPLTPTSDLYPDGLISTRWLQKYLQLIPSVFVSIHLINTHLESKELEQAADADLTRTINNLKAQLLLRNIRLIVIIVSDKTPVDLPSLNDRIYYLRKNTGLAARTGMFFLPPCTEVELEILTETVCQLAYSYSQEFYTGIAKKLRKKRGSKHTKALTTLDPELEKIPLSQAGWEVRYSFKSAVMLEFRQEIESAIKAYEQTYESALELFETFHPFNETCSKERWCEFREFLDLLVYRIVKLYFYMGQGNHAYKKYLFHLNSIEHILKSKNFDMELSKGITVWKSELNVLISKLIDYTNGALMNFDSPLAFGFDMFFPGSNLPRSGYLYLSAAQSLMKLIESSTPEINDSVLIDPYFDDFTIEELKQKVDYILAAASKDFTCGKVTNKRNNAAVSYMRGELSLLNEEYTKAHESYKYCVNVVRSDNWFPMLSLLLKKLIDTSIKTKNYADLLISKLELILISNKYSFAKDESDKDLLIPSEFSKAIQNDEPLSINMDSISSNLRFYKTSFSYAAHECFIGLPADSQVTIKCELPVAFYENLNASDRDQFFTLQEFLLNVSGNLSPLRIKHNPELDSDVLISIPNSELKRTTEPDSEIIIYEGQANLKFKPGEMKVFHITQIPRELGEAKLGKITLITKWNNVTLINNSNPIIENSGVVPWYFKDKNNNLHANHVRNIQPRSIKLSPRHSLVRISLDTTTSVAIGEIVRKPINIQSNELNPVIVSIQVKAFADNGDAAQVKWIQKGGEEKGEEAQSEKPDVIKNLRMTSSSTITQMMELKVPDTMTSPATLSLEFFVTYYEESTGPNDDSADHHSLETLIKDGVTHKLDVVKPFIVYSDVLLRTHPEAWPNFFNVDNDADFVKDNMDLAPKIWKRSKLTNSLLCLIGPENPPVEVIGSELNIESRGGGICRVVERKECQQMIMKHNDRQRFEYLLEGCRDTEEHEVRGFDAEVSMKIFWRRKSAKEDEMANEKDSIVNVFKASPLMLKFMLIEPRLVVTMKRMKYTDNGNNSNSINTLLKRAIKLRYIIENCTSHILTYSVTMGTSENFAYQGPKQLTVRMLPFSRRPFDYILYPLKRGGPLALPVLRVFDVNYRKLLTPLPASEGFIIEKSKLLVEC